MRNFIENMLHWKLMELASAKNSDAMAIYGLMDVNLPELVRDRIESTPSDHRNDMLTIQLDTEGGSIDPVEKTVEVLRHHYEQLIS